MYSGNLFNTSRTLTMIVPAGGNYIFNMTTSLLEALEMYTMYFKKAYKRAYNLII